MAGELEQARVKEAEAKLRQLKADLDKLPDTFTEITRQLDQVSQAFQLVTEGSNVGSADFAEYIENINAKMKKVGETVQALGNWEILEW